MTTAKAYIANQSATPEGVYAGLSTTALMSYVVDQLEKAGIALTFENITVSAFKLFPKTFSLVGYDEYPDASRVNRTLLQCRPKYRNLIAGKGSTKFVLTEGGRALASEVSGVLAGDARVSPRQRRGAPRDLISRYEQEVLFSKAFASWEAGDDISEFDFYHLLHLLPGAKRESTADNYSAIKNVLRDSVNTKIHNFLKALELQYAGKLIK